MNSFSFIHLRRSAVHDVHGDVVGRLQDLVVRMEHGAPPVTKIVILTEEKEELIIPWESVEADRVTGEEPLRLRQTRADLPTVRLRPDEMRAGKNILDKKVVDTKRRRVTRVNDLLFTMSEGRLTLTAIEGGLRGLLRHLGSEGWGERLARRLHWELPQGLVPWESVEPLEIELTRARWTAVYTKLARLHPADIADIVEELNPGERAAVLAALDEETAAETLTEAEPEVQTSVIQMMESERASTMLTRMEPDEAANILSDLPAQTAQELLQTMEPEEAEEVAELLTHEEDTAGGLMTTEVVTLPPELTAAEAIGRLRRGEQEAETIYYLYICEPADRLVGVLSLRELIGAKPDARLRDLMTQEVIRVSPETSFREVAETLTKYNLLALPVVGEAGEIRGIITVDDVLQVLVPMVWKKRATKKFL